MCTFIAMKHEFFILNIIIIIIMYQLKFREGLIPLQQSLHWNNLKAVSFSYYPNLVPKEDQKRHQNYMDSTNWYHTSSWDSNRHPGSTINASPWKGNLLSVERSKTFSGENMTKFVVWKGFAVLLPIGTSFTPGGYSWKKQIILQYGTNYRYDASRQP